MLPFFEEIHKLADWENKIKVLYDLNPNVKMVLSGSASLMKRSRESLAGRAVFHILSPLKYAEFLQLKGEKIPRETDFEIHERRLSILFGEYLAKGFPETLEMSENEAKKLRKGACGGENNLQRYSGKLQNRGHRDSKNPCKLLLR